jgi:pSer/pThr/pTyr-binding forkhead associated (FHA) protein
MTLKLLIVHGRPQGKSLLFPNGEYLFGRGEECHVRPNSDWVSRQHCLLRVSPNSIFVRDLGSRNGTLVNGARVVGEHPLAHGDQLQVGPLVFSVLVEEASATTEETVEQETGVHAADTGELPGLLEKQPTVEDTFDLLPNPAPSQPRSGS